MAVVLVPMTFCSLFWFFCTCVAIFSVSVHCSSFDELFQPSWAEDHVMYEGEVLKLKLDSSSGAGFASKSKYLYGRTTVQIKLVEGDSAGTVTAFYMASDGTTHNEFDFEFLGNTTGEPYLVQTNVYVNGVGNREQRLSLWFDPTKDFHSYAILWNRRQVVFMVDETPVRLYTNKEKQGVPFPKDQPMGIYSSIWNADDWATQGGRIKTDWSHAPFVSTYRGFEIDACEWLEEGSTGDQNLNKCGGFGWDKPVMARLNVHQRHQLIWVRANHLVYDYCMDNVRFTTPPAECIPRWKRP